MNDNDVLLKPSGSTSTASRCQICKKQVAKYTCPTCNLRYCSLSCFRDEKHGNCSESFYKQSIVDEVQGRNDVSKEDKQKVMDMVQRLQQMDESNDNDSESESGVDEGPLAALNVADLDNMSTEQLLAQLTESQRSAFAKMLRDPAKATELLDDDTLQQLDASSSSSWWNVHTEASTQSASSKGKGRAVPTPIALEALLPVKNQDVELPLAYNLLAVLCAYALQYHVLPDDASFNERCLMLVNLLPFVVEQSTMVLQSVHEACEYVLSRIERHSVVDRAKLSILLCRDTAAMLYENSRIQDLEQGQRVSKNKTFLALSDVYNIFMSSAAKSVKKKTSTLGASKILFYASNLDRIPRSRVTRDLDAYIAQMERQKVLEEELQLTATQRLNIDTPTNNNKKSKSEVQIL